MQPVEEGRSEEFRAQARDIGARRGGGVGVARVGVLCSLAVDGSGRDEEYAGGETSQRSLYLLETAAAPQQLDCLDLGKLVAEGAARGINQHERATDAAAAWRDRERRHTRISARAPGSWNRLYGRRRDLRIGGP